MSQEEEEDVNKNGDMATFSLVDIEEYEEKFEEKVEQDLIKHDLQLESTRLDKLRDSIDTIKLETTRKISTVKLAKLVVELEKLYTQEKKILERIDLLDAKYRKQQSKEIAISPTIKSTQKVFANSTIVCHDDDSDLNRYLRRLADYIPPSINRDLLTGPLDGQYNLYPISLTTHIFNDASLSHLRCPTSLWERLLPYQKDGVRWLCGLHEAGHGGGILGDEMGLGKTLQIITMISTLYASNMLHASVLIVCPTTLMRQWILEFHKWSPLLRICLAHGGPSVDFEQLLNCNAYHAIITSYGHIQSNPVFNSVRFSAIILDEGHKIRNPHAETTISCKRLLSGCRIILSGTPIQNNLIDIWSLMDFVYPERLGSLNVFTQEVSQPIMAGGYTNASHTQIEKSYQAASMLKDLITPHILRRNKKDVALSLPKKKEQILFCRLSRYQRELYENYLASTEVQSILVGKRNVLQGIDILRKICNHPQLIAKEQESGCNDSADDGESIENKSALPDDDFKYLLEHPPRLPSDLSGKLCVLSQVLREWWLKDHRVLIFCQTRQMLDIIQSHIDSRYKYCRMDGNTPVKMRISLIDAFNSDSSIYLFLLTTRVGGLGVNLTGADRVIIFDPDWNPSTDIQARERSWRLGQTKPVTIYRMITKGTIEEKIYHRQIFKQYLANRVLVDAAQSRFFKNSDLYDLFSLDHDEGEGSFTSNPQISDHEESDNENLTEARSSPSPSLDISENVFHDILKVAHLPPQAPSTSHSPSNPPQPFESVLLQIPEIKKQLLVFFAKNRNVLTSQQISEKFSYLEGDSVIVLRDILKRCSVFKNGKWKLGKKHRI